MPSLYGKRRHATPCTHPPTSKHVNAKLLIRLFSFLHHTMPPAASTSTFTSTFTSIGLGKQHQPNMAANRKEPVATSSDVPLLEKNTSINDAPPAEQDSAQPQTPQYDGAAGAAVSDTYKLLENILAHLDTTNLTRCQSVCRQWQLVSTRSRILRQRLFLSPAPIRAGRLGWRRCSSGGRHASRLVPHLTEDALYEGNATLMFAELHPLFKYRKDYNKAGAAFEFDAAPLLVDGPRMHSDPFITQPPVNEVRLTFVSGEHRGRPRWCRVLVEHSKGVRLSDLLYSLRRKTYIESIEALRHIALQCRGVAQGAVPWGHQYEQAA